MIWLSKLQVNMPVLGAVAFALFLSSGAAAQAQDKVSFGQLRVPNAIFVGIEKGYFDDEDISVEVEFFRSGAEVATSLAAGHIDVGATTAGATLYNAMASGLPIKIVADYIVLLHEPSPNAIAVRKELIDNGEVESTTDLKGKNIAITARGQFTHMFAGRLLESAGLTEDDVNLVTMSYPDMLAAFQGGSIDAATFVEPFTMRAEEEGFAVKFLDAAELMPDLNLAVIMYGERLLENRDLGERFMRAFHRANTTLREAWETSEGREEIADIFQKHVPQRDPSVYERAPAPMGREDLLVNVEGENGLRDQLDWYAEAGLVPERPDLNEYVDNSFAEKARDAAN